MDREKKDQLLLKVAEIQSWQKKYDESLEKYKLLLKTHPDDIQLRRKYAMVLFWAGKNDEAAKELKTTLDP